MKKMKCLEIFLVGIIGFSTIAQAELCVRVGGSEHSVGVPGPEFGEALAAYAASPEVAGQQALLDRHGFCKVDRRPQIRYADECSGSFCTRTYTIWDNYRSVMPSAGLTRQVIADYSYTQQTRRLPMFSVRPLDLSGIGEQLQLSSDDSEILNNSLIAAGIKRLKNTGVGANIRFLGQLMCSKVIVPNAVPHCTLVNGTTQIETSQEVAADLIEVLIQNNAFTGPEGTVGATNVGAALVRCSRGTFPMARAECTLVIEERPTR